MASSSLHHLLVLVLVLLLLGLTVSGQESHHLSFSSSRVVVSVAPSHLPAVSSSVVRAETWLKTHVLLHYPSTNTTAILVGGPNLLCNSSYGNHFVLPSLSNLYHSLKRWGLEREIEVSVAFGGGCFGEYEFRADLVESLVKPVLGFLSKFGYSYFVDPSCRLSVSEHRVAVEKLGFYGLKIRELEKPVLGLLRNSKSSKIMHQSSDFSVSEHQIDVKMRKLMSSFVSNPYPEKPKPVGFEPVASPVLPPSSDSDPSSGFSFIPSASPSEIPDSPPDVFANPPSPCSAFAPGSGEGRTEGVWCMAKPAVPAETLQKAMDYACGEGGGDCEEIGPNGSCYFPDNVVAHASFAFNSYWQKTKMSGGSCGFGGIAILVDSDPSYLHCKFELA